MFRAKLMFFAAVYALFLSIPSAMSEPTAPVQWFPETRTAIVGAADDVIPVDFILQSVRDLSLNPRQMMIVIPPGKIRLGRARNTRSVSFGLPDGLSSDVKLIAAGLRAAGVPVEQMESAILISDYAGRTWVTGDSLSKQLANDLNLPVLSTEGTISPLPIVVPGSPIAGISFFSDNAPSGLSRQSPWRIELPEGHVGQSGIGGLEKLRKFFDSQNEVAAVFGAIRGDLRPTSGLASLETAIGAAVFAHRSRHYLRPVAEREFNRFGVKCEKQRCLFVYVDPLGADELTASMLVEALKGAPEVNAIILPVTYKSWYGGNGKRFTDDLANRMRVVVYSPALPRDSDNIPASEWYRHLNYRDWAISHPEMTLIGYYNDEVVGLTNRLSQSLGNLTPRPFAKILEGEVPGTCDSTVAERARWYDPRTWGWIRNNSSR